MGRPEDGARTGAGAATDAAPLRLTDVDPKLRELLALLDRNNDQVLSKAEVRHTHPDNVVLAAALAAQPHQ